MSRIKIFKTFEDQELHQVEMMRATTPKERFRKLYYMQQLSSLFHPSEVKKKKIIIHYGYPSSWNYTKLQ